MSYPSSYETWLDKRNSEDRQYQEEDEFVEDIQAAYQRGYKGD